MGKDASPLDRLAAAYGIAAHYENAARETVAIAPDTKRRLLVAMGVDPDDAETHLGAIEDAEWGRGLPPVIVDRSGGADVAVEVTLPAGVGRIAWKVTLEAGGEVEGEADLADAPVVARREAEDMPFERRRIRLGSLPLGYHTLALNEPGALCPLIVAPEACWLPETMTGGRRTFGIALQLPLLRSARNWGIGDFSDLRRFTVAAGRAGADVIGLNPLHALFLDDPEAASPYSPASRLLLNPLFIAVDEVWGWNRARDLMGDVALVRQLEDARRADLVDYTAVAALKLHALKALYAVHRRSDAPDRAAAFDRFVESRTDGFRHACLFLALRDHFAHADPPRPDWRTWPEDVRSPLAEGALRFAAEKPDAVGFQLFLQWIADEQLGEAARAAAAAGMAVGLYRDLAVGADPAGAETFANPAAVIRGVSVGAPPDLFMPRGQNWGLPPFNPRALRAEGYASFVELLRANMRHAGGLRIDHVMGLMHLWCVPDGCTADLGGYLDYPLDDMLGVLALESHRNRCLVVGEDLGTVPEGFRETMEAANVLSYRVLFFEQDFDTGAFVAPDAYPEKALAVAGSHDLATLRGWFEGRDNTVKAALGLFPTDEDAAAQVDRRLRDRDFLMAVLAERGHLPEEGDPTAEDFAAAAHAFLAETRSALAMIQIDDLTGETDQVNVPATVTENPNWRRKYRMGIEEIDAGGLLAAGLAPFRARLPAGPET